MARYTLVEVSRRETITPEKITVKRVLQVTPWLYRTDAYYDLAGGIKRQGRRLIRTWPARDPVFSFLRVSSIEVETIDEDYMTNPYANQIRTTGVYSGPAILTVTYEPPDFDEDDADNSQGPDSGDQQEIDIASFQWDFSARNLTLPNERMGWENEDGRYLAPTELLQVQGVQATKIYPQLDYSITRHRCIWLPLNAILQQLGRVNSETFFVGKQGYPPETLRFDSAHATRKLTNQGAKFYEIAYKFCVQPVYDTYYPESGGLSAEGYVGWNRLFNPRESMWMRAVFLSDPARGIYLLDQDAPSQRLGSRDVSGFNLLFHPAAE